MAIHFLSAFGLGDNATNGPINGALVGFESVSGVALLPGRMTGGQSVSWDSVSGTASNRRLRYTPTVSMTTVAMGGAVRMIPSILAAGAAIFALYNGSTRTFRLRVNADGSLEVLEGTSNSRGLSSAGIFTADEWYSIEWQVTQSATVGACEVWVNGVSVINVTNVNTGTGATSLGFVMNGVAVGENEYSEFYCADSRPSSPEGHAIVTLAAGADASVQYTPNGFANNYQCVNIPHTTSAVYNRSNVQGYVDEFDLIALPADPVDFDSTIAVQVRGATQAISTTTCTQRLRARSGATLQNGTTSANIASGGNAHLPPLIMETDPDTSAAWTEAGLAALDIGYENVALTGGGNVRQMWVSAEVLVPFQSSPVLAEVTQGAVLFLERPASDALVTQGAVLLLARDFAQARITQAATYVLVKERECYTRGAQLWRIERLDGTVYTFTTHDEAIAFRGEEYTPCTSLRAGAFDQGVSSGIETGDVQAVGIFDDDLFTPVDIMGGLFDGARVDVWEAWWDNARSPRRIARGVISSIELDDQTYRMTVLTPGALLQQQPVLPAFTPACRWTLGDSRCGVDVEALKETGVVEALEARNAAQSATFRRWQDTTLVAADGYFNDGYVLWLTGNNAGVRAQVKTQAADVITLWDVLPFEIELGDTYDIFPGCDKRASTCAAKFSNLIAFGGFPDIPGTDSISRTPDART